MTKARSTAPLAWILLTLVLVAAAAVWFSGYRLEHPEKQMEEEPAVVLAFGEVDTERLPLVEPGWPEADPEASDGDPEDGDLEGGELGGDDDAAASPTAARPRIDNLIFLVGDGMGPNQVAAARIRWHGPSGRLFMERFPAVGWSWTVSSASLYTDSAAGATAFATGHKTLPRVVGQGPDGERLETLVTASLAQGKRAGLITDSVIVDATPASFAAHVPSRYEVVEIARQLAGSGVELLMSHGFELEDEEEKLVVAEAIGQFEAGGMRVVTETGQVEAAVGDAGRKVAVLLPDGSIPAAREGGAGPTLADLTRMAIERLSAPAEGNGGAEGRGFVLVVETEETDTGGHDNDLPRVLAGVKALDEAAEAAVDFARRDGRTLVVITADHETGGLMLQGGDEGGPMPYRWMTPHHTVAPVPVFAYGPGAERLGVVLDNTEIPRIISDLMGLGMFSDAEAP